MNLQINNLIAQAIDAKVETSTDDNKVEYKLTKVIDGKEATSTVYVANEVIHSAGAATIAHIVIEQAKKAFAKVRSEIAKNEVENTTKSEAK